MPKAVETPAHPKGPGFKSPKSNHASPEQIFVPEELAGPEKRGRKRTRPAEAEPTEESPSHMLHPWKVRLECALGYNIWRENGSKKSESPFPALKERYGVNRRLPARWLEKLLETGSVHDSWAGGRPTEFGEETEQTQYTKLMYLTAVCQWGLVANIHLDPTGHTKINKKGEEVEAKVDSAFLKLIWKKIMKAARKIPQLRSGKVFLMLDRASVHRSKISLEAIKEAGFTLIDQPPRSPNLNLLDAFVFPAMERWCNELGAITKAEIKAAVDECYDKITPMMCMNAVIKSSAIWERLSGSRGGIIISSRKQPPVF